jgi:hypothetical protein
VLQLVLILVPLTARVVALGLMLLLLLVVVAVASLWQALAALQRPALCQHCYCPAPAACARPAVLLRALPPEL